jgi:hypothetical protein
MNFAAPFLSYHDIAEPDKERRDHLLNQARENDAAAFCSVPD